MGYYSRMIEPKLKISQTDDELSVKDAALVVKNKEIEEKNNTIKQLTEKLQQFQSQYQDYKATCTKIIDDQRAENQKLQVKFDTLRSLSRVDHDAITELCDKLKVKDDKIEELSTKLAEVLVNRDAFKTALLVKCSEVGSLEVDKNELINKLGEDLIEIEDLESIIEGQKEYIADLVNRINDILEKHKRSTKENCQLRSEIEKLKDRLSPASDKPDDYAKGLWEALFNE